MRAPDGIDEVWLFGSAARGDSTPNSDVDILVISADLPPESLRAELKTRFGARIDLSHYTHKGMRALVSPPSLFAEHLRREGIPLFQRTKELEDVLREMGDYKSHTRDMETLRLLLDDVQRSALHGPLSPVFEYGVLGTIARNIGIIMTHYLGSVDFSVSAPERLMHLRPALNMPIDNDTYNYLQTCRHAGQRSVDARAGGRLQNEVGAIASSVAEWHAKCAILLHTEERG